MHDNMLKLRSTPSDFNFATTTERSLIVTTESREDLLTNHQRELIEIVNFVFLCTIVSLFGITSNIINIIVFCRQGFSYTVNISFCGLAISDLLSLLTQVWVNVCMNPLLNNADIPFIPAEVQYLTGGVPCVCFSRITSWITVFVTAERWLGIALPLKVKQIITANRTICIISLIYCLNFLAITPEYHNYYFDWKFYPERNRTIFGMIIKSTDPTYNSILFIITSTNGLLAFVSVSIFTAVLVYKLGQTSAWRMKLTQVNEQSESVSNRDKRTMKMIVLIASILIACCTPGVVILMVTIFVPEFSLLGRYRNAFFASWAIALLFQNVNSSINIFLYYSMSVKYRQTFHDIFSKLRNSENHEKRESVKT